MQLAGNSSQCCRLLDLTTSANPGEALDHESSGLCRCLTRVPLAAVCIVLLSHGGLSQVNLGVPEQHPPV